MRAVSFREGISFSRPWLIGVSIRQSSRDKFLQLTSSIGSQLDDLPTEVENDTSLEPPNHKVVVKSLKQQFVLSTFWGGVSCMKSL